LLFPIVGAAVSSVIGFFISCVISIIVIKKKVKVRYFENKTLLIKIIAINILTVCIMYIFSRYVYIYNFDTFFTTTTYLFINGILFISIFSGFLFLTKLHHYLKK
jgi:drug/metabolite transporter (DMT)-like permease